MKRLTTHTTTITRRLQGALCAFFALALLSALLVYLIDPSIYMGMLTLIPSPTERYPWPVTLFLLCLVVFLSVLGVGVLRHWRRIFWLLLLAFGASLIQVPVELLQIAGVLSLPAPLWYSLCRLGAAIVEVCLAMWMFRIYWRAGVWGLGKRGRAD